MSIWSRILDALPTRAGSDRLIGGGLQDQPAYYSAAGIPIADAGMPLPLVEKGEIERFWRSQPNLRKVVDYISRNAVVDLHVYQRVSDTDRQRVTDSELAALLRVPRPRTAPFRFWQSVISDGLLYDRWAVLPYRSESGRWEMVQLPAWRLAFVTDAFRTVQEVWFWGGGQDGDRWVNIPIDQVVFDYGYAPATAGLSPVWTLRDLLEEQTEATDYRRQVWRNAGRMTGWVSRPLGAKWTDVQRNRFVEWLRSTFSADGPQSGGTMLLEDGMTAGKFDAFSPQDAQEMENRRLSAIEVASAYHIAPELVGAREGNYANLDAFRQMLYGPSLGPYITPWEQTVDSQLRPMVEGDPKVYVEANVEEKLRGSFLEQAQVMQSATGAPWMTRNEARARQNLPGMDGGDELVTPLNVLVGGQASPRDSGEQNRGRDAAGQRLVKRPPVRVKRSATPVQREQIGQVLNRFFTRQRAAVLSAIGAGGDWWDGDRWNRELAEDLAKIAHTVADILGHAEAERLGYPDDWDPDQTVAFLAEVARGQADGINTTTRAQLDAALRLDIDTGTTGDPGDVFDVAQESRTPLITDSVAVYVAGFAVVEAARQISRQQNVTMTKTWITGNNPRPSHAAMDGETIPVGELFSNGQKWPRSGGSPDDAGCNCSVTTQIEPAAEAEAELTAG